MFSIFEWFVLVLQCDAFVVIVLSDETRQNKRRVISMLAVPRGLFCFGSLVILDVACCYLWLFSLYVNIKIGKNRC